MVVTVRHAKAIGYCNAGLRKWFEGRDISFSHFVLNGVSEEWVLAQGDAMATRLVAYARRIEDGKQSVGT